MSQAGLQALIADLRALKDHELDRTLALLSSAERAEVLQLLENQRGPTPSFEALAALSPWLLNRVEAARLKQVTVAGRTVMTATVARALVEAFQDLAADDAGPGKTEAIAAEPRRWWPLLRRKRAA